MRKTKTRTKMARIKITKKIHPRRKAILTLVSNACRPVIEAKRNKRKILISGIIL